MNIQPRITDAEVSSLPLHLGRAELLEEIMTTPAIDAVESTPKPPRRTPPRWAVAAAAAAAIAAIVAVPVWLTNSDESKQETPPSAEPGACWDGSPPAADGSCSKPTGIKGLEFAFPRLAGKLDSCAPSSKWPDDTGLPMPLGTPMPGDSNGVWMCDAADLGYAAEPGSPPMWIYLFDEQRDATLLQDLRDPWDPDYQPGEMLPPDNHFDAHPFSLRGEVAGKLTFEGDVGMVRPNSMFIAVYDDYPFGVMTFAQGQDDALKVLEGLGMRTPSELTKPATGDALPDLPGSITQTPLPTP